MLLISSIGIILDLLVYFLSLLVCFSLYVNAVKILNMVKFIPNVIRIVVQELETNALQELGFNALQEYG